jgi:BirA family biotin operon repressor/biotin-[acetyl-CoA-carboxylase] ligase
LAAGLATVQALDAVVPGRATLKWPNDVLVDGHKLAGLLTQVAPTGEVVTGIGLNVSQTAAELPTPQATSLATLDRPPNQVDRTGLATGLLRAYAAVYQLWALDPAGLLAAISARLGTLGQVVRASQPDGTTQTGRASRLLPDGALELALPGGQITVLRAGQVEHLRPAP